MTFLCKVISKNKNNQKKCIITSNIKKQLVKHKLKEDKKIFILNGFLKIKVFLNSKQDRKEEAKSKQKQKVQEWIRQQIQSKKPQCIQDDHFRQWRFLKQFRDVENQHRFLGYKTFRHKPSHEMNKYFTERERKQISELSLRKQPLIDSNRIDQSQRNRSLRSQGPLNPKIQFRLKKSDHQYLNPKMKFKHRTDQERLSESKMQFDQKLKSVYSSFEMRKSSIGVPKVSYYQYEDIKNNRSKSTNARYDIDTQNSFRMKVSAVNSHPENDTKNPITNKIYFDSKQEQNIEQSLAESKLIPNGRLMTAKMAQIQGKDNKTKSYWKLAKTMQLQGNKQIKDFLLRTQYDRKKDLSNLKMNMTSENFMKRPIL